MFGITDELSKYTAQFLLHLIVIRCSVPESRPNKIGGETCVIYQTHPVAHAGLKMDYVNNTLTSNVVRGCKNAMELVQKDNNLHLQVNVAVMSDVHYFQMDEVTDPIQVTFYVYWY